MDYRGVCVLYVQPGWWYTLLGVRDGVSWWWLMVVEGSRSAGVGGSAMAVVTVAASSEA